MHSWFRWDRLLSDYVPLVVNTCQICRLCIQATPKKSLMLWSDLDHRKLCNTHIGSHWMRLRIPDQNMTHSCSNYVDDGSTVFTKDGKLVLKVSSACPDGTCLNSGLVSEHSCVLHNKQTVSWEYSCRSFAALRWSSLPQAIRYPSTGTLVRGGLLATRYLVKISFLELVPLWY